MKEISTYILENLITEDVDIDAIAFCDCYNGNEKWSEYNIDIKDSMFIKIHGYVVPSEGGHDGNGMSAFPALEYIGMNLKNIDKDYQDADIYDILPEGEIDNPKILKELSRMSGKSIKCGTILYNAGYESPCIIAFDVKNATSAKYINGIYPFS